MLISSFFSLVIYTQINSELEHIEYSQRLRQERIERTFGTLPPYIGDPASQIEVIQDARERVILTLIVINAIILTISGTAGYFLAGRTLRPIQLMLDEQHRFIADASHELRTPLTSLRSEIEVGLRSKSLSKKEAQALLTSNLEEVISLQHLSEELLQLARYSSNSKEQLNKVTNIVTIVEKSMRTVEPLATDKKISLSYDKKIAQVYGEEQSLTQLFVILLDNAIKYSLPESTVSITTKIANKKICISVKDFGIGMDSSDIPHIFDRFYQANKSRTKQESTGYGLGLSIARQIVKAHNGTITVISNPRKSIQQPSKQSKKRKTLHHGSTFTVTLPRVSSS